MPATTELPSRWLDWVIIFGTDLAANLAFAIFREEAEDVGLLASEDVNQRGSGRIAHAAGFVVLFFKIDVADLTNRFGLIDQVRTESDGFRGLGGDRA